MYSQFIVDAIDYNSIDEKTDNNSLGVNEAVSDFDSLKAIENKINDYSKQIIQNNIEITNQKFKMISLSLIEDIIMIYLYNRDLSNSIISVVDNLNNYYRDLYLNTKSPIARLYEGMYAVVYKLYHMREANDKYDKILKEDLMVKKYLLKAIVDGICNIDTDIPDETKEALTWLEDNDYISIYSLNGYTIRLNDKHKFKINLESKKYRIMYYLDIYDSSYERFPKKESYKIIFDNSK